MTYLHFQFWILPKEWTNSYSRNTFFELVNLHYHITQLLNISIFDFLFPCLRCSIDFSEFRFNRWKWLNFLEWEIREIKLKIDVVKVELDSRFSWKINFKFLTFIDVSSFKLRYSMSNSLFLKLYVFSVLFKSVINLLKHFVPTRNRVVLILLW